MKTGRTGIVSISLMFVVAFAIFTPFQAVWAAETFTMAFFADPAQEPLLKAGELIYTEAFRRLGFMFAYQVYPSKRCSVMADTGEVDGEPVRNAGHNQPYPNLIRVAEPVSSATFSAFATNAALQLNGWESLRGTAYRVEYILGTTLAEHNLQPVVQPELLSVVTTEEQALKKLRAGRTDIFVQTEDLILPLLQTAEFEDAGIVKVGVMETFAVYPFLHKKHAALAPKLAEVLKQMKAEGLFEQYQAQAAQFFQPK